MTSGLTAVEELSNPQTSAENCPWSELAPKRIRKAARNGNDALAWKAWREHLKNRKTPRPLAKLLKSRDLGELLRREAKSCQRRSPSNAANGEAANGEAASGEFGSRPADLRKCFSAIRAAHRLPAASEHLSQGEWWRSLRRLLHLVQEANRSHLAFATLPGQLVRGELALTLAYLFPELTPCAELLDPAREALSTGIEELLDGEGGLHSKEWTNLWPLLGCWTRCRALGEELKNNCWHEEAEAQFSWFIREAVRFRDAAGRQLLGPTANEDAAGHDTLEEMLPIAVRLARDPELRKVIKLGERRGARNQADREKGLPRAGVTSEWAEVALLRPWWSSDSPRLAVLYPDKRVKVALSIGRELFCSGDFNPVIRLNGELTEPISDWEEVCWFSDRDCDYLELEVALDSGWRVQRHLLLGRQDPVLFLADVLLGDRSAQIEYVSTLPLTPDVKFTSERETRDGILRSGKSKAVVLPLALPEWKIDSRAGSLTQTEAGLELRQSFTGQGLVAPLWLDLNPRRANLPRTWRQLTVGEDRRIQRPDEAVGYRVQVGREQWLIYRSLRQPSNRTLLGHNLSSEFLVGRFSSKGQVASIVEVE